MIKIKNKKNKFILVTHYAWFTSFTRVSLQIIIMGFSFFFFYFNIWVLSNHIFWKNFRKEKKNAPRAGKLVELASGRENDQCNFCITQNWKLKGFLEQPISAFREGHLPACSIFYTLHLSFPSHHSHKILVRRKWKFPGTKKTPDMENDWKNFFSWLWEAVSKNRNQRGCLKEEGNPPKKER